MRSSHEMVEAPPRFTPRIAVKGSSLYFFLFIKKTGLAWGST
jgi:hypothetical protein